MELRTQALAAVTELLADGLDRVGTAIQKAAVGYAPQSTPYVRTRERTWRAGDFRAIGAESVVVTPSMRRRSARTEIDPSTRRRVTISAGAASAFPARAGGTIGAAEQFETFRISLRSRGLRGSSHRPGTLRRGIRLIPAHLEGNRVTVGVISTAPYSKYVEFGMGRGHRKETRFLRQSLHEVASIEELARLIRGGG